MDQTEARARFAAGRVARLASLAPRRQPSVVPVAFAMGSGPDGDAIAFAVDSTSTSGFRTLQQVAAQPRVSVLVDHDDDHYDDHCDDQDWSRSWWVRADGEARVLEAGPTFRVVLAGLSAKYRRYELEPPPGPVVVVDVKTWDWSEGTAG